MPLPPRFDHHENYWKYFDSVQNHTAAAILHLCDVIELASSRLQFRHQLSRDEEPKMHPGGLQHSFTIDLPPIVVQTKRTSHEDGQA